VLNCLSAIGNNAGIDNNGAIDNEDTFVEKFKNGMQVFLKDNSNSNNAASFSFNSKTGEAVGTFTVRIFKDDVSFSGITASNIASKLKESARTTLQTIQENVGDMVYNKYLYLEDTNRYNSQGWITANECTPISADCTLNNFDILYKHTYL